MVNPQEETDTFAKARASFEEMLCWLEGTESAALTHAELEDQVERRGREVQRLMLQDHLDLRSLREERVRVVDAEGIVHANVEPDHGRQLSTVMGTVGVRRLAYRHVGVSNLHPADAALNLPVELHSHGLRRLAAIESTRGSFDKASEAIERSTGVAVAKRQVESLTAAAATDVEDFYAERAPEPDASTEVMVICRRQGDRHEARRAARSDRQGRLRCDPKARDPPVQGREALPQTDGRGGRGLRPLPRPPQRR